MTTEVVEAKSRDDLPTPYELGAMSTETLRTELAQSLTMTAKHLRRLAAVWNELERRGEDLSQLRTGLAIYLPQVASGQLSADAVIRYAGQPLMLRTIATLPADVQESMARGDQIEVLTVDESGQYMPVKISSHALTAVQARLVFAPGRIRPVEEQRAQLESAKLVKAGRARMAMPSRVRYDRPTDSLRIGHVRASMGEVLGAIAAAAIAPASEGELTSVFNVRFLEIEHKAIKLRAAQAGMTLQDYCRALLVMQSVI